jgi:hypothetical protein
MTEITKEWDYGKIKMAMIYCDKCQKKYQTSIKKYIEGNKSCKKCEIKIDDTKKVKTVSSEKTKKENKITYTYILIEKDTNICKIGRTENLQGRLIGQGYDKSNIKGLLFSGTIEIESSIYFESDIEGHLHDMFKHWRIKQYREESGGTEWFVCANKIMEMVRMQRLNHKSISDNFFTS